MTSPAGIETRCKTCGKKIVFAKLGNGKLIPLDMVAPVYVLLEDGSAVQARVVVDAINSAMVLGQDVGGYYVSHFSTCPQASEHSKSKKKEVVVDGQA